MNSSPSSPRNKSYRKPVPLYVPSPPASPAYAPTSPLPPSPILSVVSIRDSIPPLPSDWKHVFHNTAVSDSGVPETPEDVDLELRYEFESQVSLQKRSPVSSYPRAREVRDVDYLRQIFRPPTPPIPTENRKRKLQDGDTVVDQPGATQQSLDHSYRPELMIVEASVRVRKVERGSEIPLEYPPPPPAARLRQGSETSTARADSIEVLPTAVVQKHMSVRLSGRPHTLSARHVGSIHLLPNPEPMEMQSSKGSVTSIRTDRFSRPDLRPNHLLPTAERPLPLATLSPKSSWKTERSRRSSLTLVPIPGEDAGSASSGTHHHPHRDDGSECHNVPILPMHRVTLPKNFQRKGNEISDQSSWRGRLGFVDFFRALGGMLGRVFGCSTARPE
ncbi:hypothetical protein VNI00_001322 [Paramarasmius palmivorus]|uniref:Uncharacterized protein n=1 Tax=Paramarasmius palmivorus TaxID=297713 RepID=A0AAW0E9D5_9AGAR